MMRQEVSKKNKYYLEKYRRLELKNFCLQYPEWEKEYYNLSTIKVGLGSRYGDTRRGTFKSDPVAAMAIKRASLREKIDLINTTAMETDELFAEYIILAVTKGYSYDYFYTVTRIPCCSRVFYNLIRKFYWNLDKKK